MNCMVFFSYCLCCWPYWPSQRLNELYEVILIANLIRTIYSIELENKHFKQNDNTQLEDNIDTGLDSDTTRFQREELFKHNALRECKQKLTLTVKASSEPNHASGDEYIPIDHVLGPNKKRIRLLHPYVLRLQRKLPFQVYKLNRIDTVRGIIATPTEEKLMTRNDSKRLQRDTHLGDSEKWSGSFGSASVITLDHNDKPSFSIKIRERNKSRKSISKNKFTTNSFYVCADTNIWHYSNKSLVTRKTRLRRNIKKYEENVPNRWTPGERDDINSNKDEKFYDEYEDFSQNNLNLQDKNVHPVQISDVKNSNSFSDSSFDSSESNLKTKNLAARHKKNKEFLDSKLRDEEKSFALYEIGDPDLWYTAQVQLFEKLSTPEGKTVWNDLTKEDIASVSSFNPEWSNEDLNVQYKPIDWLARNEFTLPNNSLCLVVPLKVDSHTPVFDKYGDYIIVPIDDIIPVNDIKGINKRDKKPDNLSDTSTEGSEVEQRRRVVVRVTRALMGGSAKSLKIIFRGADHYLKLPHTKPHHAQIDIEGRADENELVLVGALGRLTMIVSDTTRKSRSILTVQATNTGLAAAPFRVFIRECTPELMDEEIERSEKIIAGPELLPPRHTRTFRLSVPLENAINSAHCVIALLNQDDESIAIRDVRIKRDDRCFCVWHCDCVCLSEDPKLLCRGLTEAQMVAAGLTALERSRHTRSICYPDVVSINFFVTFIGVILALLLLGVCKAILGLLIKCVGTCGLHLLLQMPRQLDRYHESSIRCRPVVYDDEGWPVHPDSKDRTVRVVSVPVEFILNIIFFVTLPCLMIWEAIRKLVLHFKAKETGVNTCFQKRATKKCFSSHDAQVPCSITVEDFIGTAQQELHFVDDIGLCNFVIREENYWLDNLEKGRSCAPGSGRNTQAEAPTCIRAPAWRERLQVPRSMRQCVVDAILPNLEDWLLRREGFVTFRLIQILTGHGCFGVAESSAAPARSAPLDDAASREAVHRYLDRGPQPRGHYYMRLCKMPLLCKKTCCNKNDESLCSDSDQDTEYVLMQMQKSSESLAKCQQNKDEKSEALVNKNFTTGNKKR